MSFTVTANWTPGLAERLVQAYAGALYRKGEAIMADSKENYVPVDLSGLKGTGHVGLPQIEGSDITVTLSFGGPAAPYALAIHEHLSEHSPLSWRIAAAHGRVVHFNIGGPKYLELPLLAAKADFVASIAADAAETLR